MKKFIKDERGTSPAFAAIVIACAITAGTLFVQGGNSTMTSNNFTSCGGHVLSGLFGRGCSARSIRVTSSSIVFVKAR